MAGIGAWGEVGGVGGTAGVCGRSAGLAEPVGGAEVTGSGAGGPGCAADERVTDGFPAIGAPRPIRRTPVAALRCTGYAPEPDGVLGGGVAAAGVPVPLRLGPETGEFAAAGPACALWTTGAVPPEASASGVRLGVAAAFWTRTGAVPVPAVVVSAGAAGAAVALWTAAGVTAAAPGPVAAEEEDAVVAGAGAAAGVAAAAPESAFARWTLRAGPLVRGTALLGPAGVPVEPALARWTLSAGPLVRVTELPGPPPDAAAGRTGAAGAGPVGAGLPARGGVPAEPVAGARWTLTAGPLEGVTAARGLPVVPLAPEVRLPEPVAVASPVAAGAGSLGPVGAALPTGPVVGARWTLTAGPLEGVTAARGLPVVPRAPVVVASPVVDAGRTGAAGAGLLGVAPLARGGVPTGPVAGARWTLTAGPLEGVTAARGLPVVSLAPVVVASPVVDAGRTGAAGAVPVGVGAPARGGVPAVPVAGARWTLTAGPLERVTAAPGLAPMAPEVRLPEPVAVAPPVAAGVGSLGPAGAGLPTGPVAGARWTWTADPPERAAALPGPPAPGWAEPDRTAPGLVPPAAGAPDGAGPDETGPDGVGPDEAGPDGTEPSESGPDEAGPDGTGPSESAPDGAGPDETGPGEAGPDGAGPDEAGPGVGRGAGGAGRWATGRDRRCTAGVAGALVSGLCRWGLGGTAVTRGPVGRDAVTGRDARCTGGVSPCAWAGAGSDGSGPATGRTREGGSSPETGPADVVSAFLISPPGAPSRTAWDRVPVREGFCQVLSRPPNPESATPVRPRAARWIGGSPVQPTTAAGWASADGPAPAEVPTAAVPVTAAAGTAPVSGPVPEPVPACAPVGAERAADAAVPPLSRSRNPTDQPSAPPRVTRDAICSV
ncbi:hypothetical protein ABZ825_20325 [Streptomyces tauricus]|uniref:hypothetical protein n=1 Tax=Streptomyces tauricus TaxID=68274 RepID=UPI0033CD1722